MNPSGKRQRLRSDETRELLVQAGLDALAAEGLSFGLDAVNLEQAVRAAGVPRSSAYAVWSTDDVYAPQELFQREVLMRAVDDRRETTDALMATVAAFLEDPPAGLSHAEMFRELVRVASEENFRQLTSSTSWRIVFAMRTIVHTTPAERQDTELLAWMRDNEEQLRLETIESLYKPMAELFGLVPREEFGDDAFHLGEIGVASIAEGLAMRQALKAGDYLFELQNPLSDRDDANWSLYSLLFDRVIDVFFERKDPTELDVP